MVSCIYHGVCSLSHFFGVSLLVRHACYRTNTAAGCWGAGPMWGRTALCGTSKPLQVQCQSSKWGLGMLCQNPITINSDITQRVHFSTTILSAKHWKPVTHRPLPWAPMGYPWQDLWTPCNAPTGLSPQAPPTPLQWGPSSCPKTNPTRSTQVLNA